MTPRDHHLRSLTRRHFFQQSTAFGIGSLALANLLTNNTPARAAAPTGGVASATLSRAPTPIERTRLTALYAQQLDHFQQSPQSAKQIADAPDAAAWTMLCNVLLNLDETLTKE